MSAGSRPLRADARRNRDAILAAARAVFEAEGIGAPTDGIAVAAGVGNATLYRNFPTRDELLAAVIADSVERLLADSAELDDRPAAEALREWLYRLAWQLRIWNDLPSCIADAMVSADSAVRTVCARLTTRTGELLERARQAGAVAPEATATGVFELVNAVSWAVDRFGDDADEARRRVEFATAGVFARS